MRYGTFIGGACVCLFAATVSTRAAKQCERGMVPIPSVNVAGNVDTANDLGEGNAKLCVNIKNRKFTVKVVGQTTNNSGRAQTYKNNPDVNDFYGFIFDEFADSTKLRVSKAGKANVTAKGTFPPQA